HTPCEYLWMLARNHEYPNAGLEENVPLLAVQKSFDRNINGKCAGAQPGKEIVIPGKCLACTGGADGYRIRNPGRRDLDMNSFGAAPEETGLGQSNQVGP
ncbi:MAG: hypothetical protein VW169_06665, partial [Rhodospirillaceae bacterium]